MRGPLFSAIFGPAKPAESSFCASRTPTLERSQDRFRDQLMTDMRWLGLDWDEGPDVGGPSGSVFARRSAANSIGICTRNCRRSDQAYPCYCTAEDLELSRKLQRMSGKPPRYAGTCRGLTAAQRAEREARGLKPTLRFAVPVEQIIEFIDAVHGPQRFARNDIGDFIIRREDGTPAFFFCNAVDDSAMGVTQVLRGDDHLTNTPRQLMLLDALGMRSPGLRASRAVGGRGRCAAVEAARQHQCA